MFPTLRLNIEKNKSRTRPYPTTYFAKKSTNPFRPILNVQQTCHSVRALVNSLVDFWRNEIFRYLTRFYILNLKGLVRTQTEERSEYKTPNSFMPVLIVLRTYHKVIFRHFRSLNEEFTIPISFTLSLRYLFKGNAQCYHAK